MNWMDRVKEGLTKTVEEEWWSCGKKKKQGTRGPSLVSCPQNKVTTLEQRQEEGRGNESMRE